MTTERDDILDTYEFLLKEHKDIIKTHEDMILIEVGFMGGLSYKVPINMFGIVLEDIMNVRRERFGVKKNERTV